MLSFSRTGTESYEHMQDCLFFLATESSLPANCTPEMIAPSKGACLDGHDFKAMLHFCERLRLCVWRWSQLSHKLLASSCAA